MMTPLSMNNNSSYKHGLYSRRCDSSDDSDDTMSVCSFEEETIDDIDLLEKPQQQQEEPIKPSASSFNDSDDPLAKYGFVQKKRALWKDKGGQAKYTLHGDNLKKSKGLVGGLMDSLSRSTHSRSSSPMRASSARDHHASSNSRRDMLVLDLDVDWDDSDPDNKRVVLDGGSSRGFSSSRADRTRGRSTLGSGGLSSSRADGNKSPPSTRNRRAAKLNQSSSITLNHNDLMMSQSLHDQPTKRSSTSKSTLSLKELDQPTQQQRPSLMERASSFRSIFVGSASAPVSPVAAPKKVVMVAAKAKRPTPPPPRVDIFLSLHSHLQKFNMNQF